MVRGGHEHDRPGEPPLIPPRLAGATAAAAGLALAAPLPPGPRAESYVDGPPPGHTGGFGEPTCAACHFDAPGDPPEGDLEVRFLPAADAGEGTRRIEVSLWAADLSRGGFQLSARYAEGPRPGSQAGELRAVDGRVTVIGADSGGVRYAVQTAPGSTGAEGDTLRWLVAWEPPHAGSSGAAGGVRIHVAANASNDDASAFGDRIYTACVRPGRGGEETGARPCDG